jgi:hypothetical protein
VPAVGDNVGNGGKRPAIEEIIEAPDGAGPSVTVMGRRSGRFKIVLATWPVVPIISFSLVSIS